MIYAFGPFELDERRFELRRDGEPVALQRRAFDMLLYLIRNAGAVCTREDLIRHVWNGAHVTKDAIAHAALLVRTALDDDDGAFVRTVRGRGYSFDAELTVRPDRATPPLFRGVPGAADGWRDSRDVF